MRLTDKRRAWLARLLVGPANRPRGRTGYDCMKAGLTEWNYVDSDGTPISFDDAKQRFGLEHVWLHVHANGDRITEAGRAILKEEAMTRMVSEVLTLDGAFEAVREEYARAVQKFTRFNSAHEGYAVLLEEVDELWAAIKTSPYDAEKARGEAIQVAAMAIRFLTECPVLAFEAS